MFCKIRFHPKIRFNSFADDLQIYIDAQYPNYSMHTPTYQIV